MLPQLKVKKQGAVGLWLDQQTQWLMRHLIGVSEEALQKTHRWNNHHLPEHALASLLESLMIFHPGDTEAASFGKMPIVSTARSHMTRYGGWKKYLVLAPPAGDANVAWHIGWKWPGGGGVSRITVRGPVRVLVGPGPTHWFGVSLGDNFQIPLEQIGTGIIGDGSSSRELPLF